MFVQLGAHTVRRRLPRRGVLVVRVYRRVAGVWSITVVQVGSVAPEGGEVAHDPGPATVVHEAGVKTAHAAGVGGGGRVGAAAPQGGGAVGSGEGVGGFGYRGRVVGY